MHTAATVKKRKKCWLSGYGSVEIEGSEEARETVQRPEKLWVRCKSLCQRVAQRLPTSGKLLRPFFNLHPTSGANGNVRHMPNGSKVGTHLFGGRVPGLRPRKKNTVRWVQDRWQLSQWLCAS